MQATNPPGVGWPGLGTAGSAAAADGTWSPWSVRKLLDELERRRERNHANFLDLNWPKVAVYTVGRNGHAVRIDHTGRTHGGGQEQLPSAWFHERYPHDLSTWGKSELQRFHVESIPGPVVPFVPLETEPHTLTRSHTHPRLEPNTHAHSHSSMWEGATRGWVVGAVLLAVLVLIVRLTEKCLDKKLFKRTRRQSDEWPRPNVLATSQHLSTEIVLGSIPEMDDTTFPTDLNRITSTDLPPPYSECANNEANANGGHKVVVVVEEPPPPYSACYVAYSNPKDGIPSVHFLNRRRQNLFDARLSESGPSSRSDTQITPAVSSERRDVEKNAENGCVENAEGNSEVVFENGRIVEREECVNDVSITENSEPSRSNSECHVVCIQDNTTSHERVISA